MVVWEDSTAKAKPLLAHCVSPSGSFRIPGKRTQSQRIDTNHL